MFQLFLKSKISKYKFIGEIRSMSNETGHSILIKTYITHDGNNVTVFFTWNINTN